MRSALFVMLAACSGGGGGAGQTEHEGVYTVDTWTRNGTACDAEGASIAEQNDPHFFLKNENFFGERFINLNICPSIEQCQADARDDETLHIGQWGFQQGNDADGWSDDSVFAFLAQDTCRASRRQSTLVFDGDAFRLEERTSSADFAPEGGDCPDEAAEAAVAGAPCEAFEVLTATLAAEF